MKPLEIEFRTNANLSGIHTFTQLKRNDNVALYVRRNLNGKTVGFEVFKIKLVKAGAPLPNGTFVQEDYEAYPGASAFGKTAYFCVSEERANEKFNELTQLNNVNENDIEEQEIETKIIPVMNIENTNNNTNNVTFVIPEGEFTHAQFAEVNHKPKPIMYVHLQELLKSNKIKLVGARKSASGRGRPTNYFAKV